MFDTIKGWFVTNLEWVVVQRILGVLFMTTLATVILDRHSDFYWRGDKKFGFFWVFSWHRYKQCYLSSCLSNSAANSFHFDRV
jgi:hypothetical protein